MANRYRCRTTINCSNRIESKTPDSNTNILSTCSSNVNLKLPCAMRRTTVALTSSLALPGVDIVIYENFILFYFTMRNLSLHDENDSNPSTIKQHSKYRAMFDYSLSTPWYRITAGPYSKQVDKKHKLLKHPFLIQWNPMDRIEHRRNHNHNIYKSMPSSNQRSTSTTNRPFTIVLTNNSELMQHTCTFQFPVNYNNFFPQITHQRHTIHPVQNGANNNNDDIPEQLLNNLLGLE
ncbi:unnamed protein product, partial [Rotaria socialis]